jgi:hypothetical protein
MDSGPDTFMVTIRSPKLSPTGVEQSPGSPGITSCRGSSSEYELSKVGFPIRKSADQRLFAPPHGLSQRTTSFIASQRQGIHRIPLRHLIALMIDVRHRTLAGPTNRQCQKDHCLPNISDRNDHPSGTAVCWRAHHRPCRIYSLFTMLKNPRSRARRAAGGAKRW